MRNSCILLAALFLFSAQLRGQNPVKWSFQAKEAGNGTYSLIFTGTIDDGWYTYSQFLESEDGPVPTSFTFQEGPHYKLEGKAKESGEKFTIFDKVFEMNLTKFKHKAIFTQMVKVSDASKPIEGYLSYMVCNDEMCLPPKEVDFKFVLPAAGAAAKEVKPEETTPAGTEATGIPPIPSPADSGAAAAPAAAGTTAAYSPENPPPAPNDPNFKGFFWSKRPDINAASFLSSCGVQTREISTSNWGIFFGGFLGGLFALLTPCVFPMIPMTVSYFVKRSKDRKTGLRNAFIYAASIVFIYVALGVAVTAAFGPTILNEMSTNMYFNLLFFVVFVIFALSFFGMFEITLPSSWVNKSDQMADKGGLLGIFFMAFTLALVSFSCTGPIVGTLLVEAARSNDGAALFGVIPMKPTMGMFGFGLALALPFGLFAMFPGWLNSLPKSGGWMDNVKITLGLVELALALKFLSTADMVEHWGLLRFETFLALWLIISVLLGLYQFGLIPWKGNHGRPGIGRLTVGSLSLIFAVYLGYGLFNYQSLSLLSGLAPPVHYSYKYEAEKKGDKSHGNIGCPHGLNCYHDFDEALAEAKRQNKPLFVDFTGHGCVNCRKMEENVWDKPGIIERLRNDYIVVSLYVDDKERLFPDNKFSYLLDPLTNEKIRTVGDKWSSFQVNNFNVSAQPYYVLMHHDGKTLLNEPTDYARGNDPNVYRSFLECGLQAFSQIKGPENGLMGVHQDAQD